MESSDLMAAWVAATKPVVLPILARTLKPHLRHLLDDAAQETWIRAWRGRHRLSGPGELAPWIATIARNEARRINAQDARERRRQFKAGQELEGTPASPEPVEPSGFLEEKLGRLPEPHRGILEAVLEGLDEAGLAARFSVARGTVKSRLSRAREAWSRLLAEDSIHITKGGAE